MKISTHAASLIMLATMAFFFAHIPAFSQTLRGNGNVKTESRTVSNFKGIDVSGGFAVEVILGNKEGVVLEAEENLLSNIKTDVRNGVLHIYNDKSLNSSKPMKAFVTVKELNNIDISGGVKVTGKSTFKTGTFDLDMSGGSKVILALQVQTLKADLSGGSNVTLTGRANEVTVDMSGASKVEASELEAKNVKIEASGGSKIKVFAKENLDINASGASNVAYKGSPKIDAETSAAAKISKMN
ncbi:head GIN domain-containing protein [Pontibacter arcticus]|uniref:DUF2807 domain-containing protein n=1 Tax=Pontibacter arcticus TaxID=2080288 RepID=A0A364RIT0_9BACT|nr:head GIN domain-containing protein [Pontibacter arcticus]RAU84240.1 DUF2807 domain-containing protein [Pontibacter arcticus]